MNDEWRMTGAKDKLADREEFLVQFIIRYSSFFIHHFPTPWAGRNGG